jgi:hypothetical protein
MSPRWVPDTKTDWSTDCRSKCDIDFDFDKQPGQKTANINTLYIYTYNLYVFNSNQTRVEAG